jgi:hypothetical protein
MSDTTNHDLLFKSDDRTNELADGELDERDLEGINGGDIGDNVGKFFKGAAKFATDVAQIPYKAGRGIGQGIREGLRD